MNSRDGEINAGRSSRDEECGANWKVILNIAKKREVLNDEGPDVVSQEFEGVAPSLSRIGDQTASTAAHRLGSFST